MANNLFPHQFNVPFLIERMAAIVLAVTTKVPLLDNLPLTFRKEIKLFAMNKDLFQFAKFAMANLFTSLLRLTATPSAHWSPLSAFTHNVRNVMRGRRLSLRHSVKHYEARKNRRVIILFNGLLKILDN
jgi:hypothetical protein